MSSHRRATKYFSRKFNARKALLRGLIVSLVEHGRIKTTVDKAKELRRHVEKAITLGKKDDLATRRLLMSRVPNQKTVETIVGDLSKRFNTRPGGYTRIIKIGRRPGDTAEMAFLEFVDYDWQAADAKEATKAAKGDAKKAESKEKAKAAKKSRALVAAKRKSVKQLQKKSRREARA
ncbi:MAG: 50S ribosomal protein L17 [Bdellovibrio sp. CG10_big_fil_rev_8_21_14_0_10_47_8]|nr:MAG: 50S ribosomal protein L17 [Bdellovibrio sp. CG10_big_fil_rev_8_21_14_0_10_47_8]